jgi:hypothetical protein
MLAVAALTLAACTGHTAKEPTAPPTTPSTRTAAIGTAPPTSAAGQTPGRDVHPTRDAFAAALPSVGDLSWLPDGTGSARDQDLTDRLVFVGCSAAPHRVASNEASATNVTFERSGRRIAKVTYYDAASTDDAAQFMAGVRAFLRCPNQGAPVSTALLALGAPTLCDDTLALRTRQPVSETVDAWCRVGNLVAWVHLDPQDGVAPTDAQAVATIDAAGTRLGALVA